MVLRDWRRVQCQACSRNSADRALVDDALLGWQLIREVATWGSLMAKVEAVYPNAMRFQPESGVWSALEHACHVRDLLPVMETHVQRMLTEDRPVLDKWDQNASVLEDRNSEQQPVLVIEKMTSNARSFAHVLSSIESHAWDRQASNQITVRGLARFVLYEVIHHRNDAFGNSPINGDNGRRSPYDQP